VKILLARGADASVKDTFYKATAMTWALDGKHFEIVKLLLPKVPEDAGDVLSTGVSESNQELVQAALATGKVSAEDMTVAMAGAMDDPKNAAIVEALKKAGAVPPPTVDAAVLQSYAGRYRGDPGPEVTFSVKDGKLIVSSSGQPPTPLMPSTRPPLDLLPLAEFLSPSIAKTARSSVLRSSKDKIRRL